MSMNSPHESVKEIAGDVWKNNRALAIAVLIVAAVVVYYLYKKGSSAVVATTPIPTSSTGVPANIRYGDITNITKTVTGQPAPAPAPAPVSVGQIAIVRGKQTSGIDKAWDSSHTGVPVRAQPSGSAAIVSLAAFGSTVPLLRAALTAAPNQRGGSSQWYPVSGGYISAWDIASIK